MQYIFIDHQTLLQLTPIRRWSLPVFSGFNDGPHPKDHSSNLDSGQEQNAVALSIPGTDMAETQSFLGILYLG
jgi:hypothetical protein